MGLKVCSTIGCPTLTSGTKCDECRRKARARRGTTTEQGLGWAHQKRKRELLPDAIGTLCPLGCGELMLEGQALDLDHSTPRVLNRAAHGDRIVHARCNRAAGARLGHELRRGST